MYNILSAKIKKIKVLDLVMLLLWIKTGCVLNRMLPEKVFWISTLQPLKSLFYSINMCSMNECSKK